MENYDKVKPPGMIDICLNGLATYASKVFIPGAKAGAVGACIGAVVEDLCNKAPSEVIELANRIGASTTYDDISLLTAFIPAYIASGIGMKKMIVGEGRQQK